MANEHRNGSEISGPILHVIVIGFHHKKGCQVHFIPFAVNNGFCKYERRLDCLYECGVRRRLCFGTQVEAGTKINCKMISGGIFLSTIAGGRSTCLPCRLEVSTDIGIAGWFSQLWWRHSFFPFTESVGSKTDRVWNILFSTDSCWGVWLRRWHVYVCKASVVYLYVWHPIWNRGTRTSRSYYCLLHDIWSKIFVIMYEYQLGWWSVQHK